MIRLLQLLLVLLLGIGLGYFIQRPPLLQAPADNASDAKPSGAKKLLYYRHPMNPQVTSSTPAKDEMGMDYVAVYAEPSVTAVAPSTSAKILYYRHPMGAADTSPVPKKDEMGMDYLPVYEGEQASVGQIQISPEKIQKLGITTATISQRTLIRSIHALGSIQVDESRIYAVTPRFEGWVQHLWVNTLGQTVKQGQPLLDIYSPELLTAQQEYLIARQGQQALQQASPQAQETARQLTDNALQRLHNWAIAPAQLQHLKTTGKVLDNLQLLAPVNGVVVEKPVVVGMRFMPGDLLLRIADLSRVWLVIDVFEQDSAGVTVGQMAQVQINAYPERLFSGRVAFIYPTLAVETRTVKVRIELPNEYGLLKPGLYGTASLAVQAEQGERLAVPDPAVIDSGVRQWVLLQKDAGHFEPRTVKLGQKAEGYYQVLDGLLAGDVVVTRANFLIDAESNLKSALQGFAAASSAISPPPVPATGESQPQGH